MIKKLTAMIVPALKYICIATVITQVVLLAAIQSKGGLTPEKRKKIGAIVAGVDTHQIRKDERERREADSVADQSHHIFGTAIEFRQAGITDSNQKLETMRLGLLRERQRYEILRSQFAERLDGREAMALDSSHRDLQLILESMNARQAREHLVLIMDEGGIDDVVGIMSQMPETKKKKILAEFRQPGDEDRVHQILIRLRDQEQVNANDGDVVGS